MERTLNSFYLLIKKTTFPSSLIYSNTNNRLNQPKISTPYIPGNRKNKARNKYSESADVRLTKKATIVMIKMPKKVISL